MDGRRDSKKNRNSTKGGRHQSEAENEISDGENLNQSQTDADLVNDFRNTLHTLNTQFTDLENQDRDFICLSKFFKSKCQHTTLVEMTTCNILTSVYFTVSNCMYKSYAT